MDGTRKGTQHQGAAAVRVPSYGPACIRFDSGRRLIFLSLWCGRNNQ